MDMELYHASVMHGGNRGAIVRRPTSMTAAELIVLMRLHGADAVSDVAVAGREDRDDRTEFSNLAQRYNSGGKNGNGRVVDALFPGARPILPADASDIGLADQQFRGGNYANAVAAAAAAPKRPAGKGTTEASTGPAVPARRGRGRPKKAIASKVRGRKASVRKVNSGDAMASLGR